MMPEVSELRRDFLVTQCPAPIVRLGQASRPARQGPCAIAIGAFDGVHVGHRALLERTILDARARGIAAVAVTFDPDPDVVVSPAPAQRLLSTRERLELLVGSGVDAVLVIPFTRELAALDHAAFFKDVLLPAADVRAVHVGRDFRLGAHGASDVAVITAWCAPRGIEVFGHDLVLEDGRPVSATRIRSLLTAGDVAAARAELGRRYMVRGPVRTGRGEGRGMGFPTANIEVDAARQMPAEGVYAALAEVEGHVWPAAVNVGLPPMYRDCPGASPLEANIIGFAGDLYGREVGLAFDRFIRPSRRFASTEELVETVLANIEEIKQAFGRGGVSIR